MGTEPGPTPLPGRIAASSPLGSSAAQTAAVPATPGQAAARQPGLPEMVGPYRVLKEIGRGGMGVVYLGVRDDLPQRHVAIKVIHRGMAVGEVLERFNRERAALASLNHPNIARLLDGGSSASGEPYFVMEHVEGRPIDEYCDGRRLTLAERLRLFQQVCAAVQHAHQHLVVHRDIKPRNILVAADGQPKLLDFGIAKLLNPALSAARDAPTETGLRVMTPEYASPEQIRGEPITTSSDVYSLGVVLFELLTGRRPYRLRTRVWKELERVICEEDPERPSTAVTRVEASGGDGPPSDEVDGEQSSRGGERTPEVIGRARGERPLRLRRALAGDLDNIVLKALRKEPQRRYASAEQLAEDIQRHLDGQPVSARPDTFVYRASKFVRRNRGGVLASGVVLAAILGGSAAAMRQAREADERRAEAVSAARRADDQRIETERALVEVQGERSRQREIARRVWLEISPRFAEEGGSVEARRALVDLCEEVYRDLARDAAADDADFWREYAQGRHRSGLLLRGARSAGVGDTQQARAAFADAAERFRLLLRDDPEDAVSAVGFIRSSTRLADLLRSQLGQPVEARAMIEGAVRTSREWLARSHEPEVLDAAAAAIQALGDMELRPSPNQPASAEGLRRAEPLWEESAALWRARLAADPQCRDRSVDTLRRAYGGHLIRRAVWHREIAGRAGLPAALAALDEAEAVAVTMLDRDPGEPRNRRHLARVLLTRADVLFRVASNEPDERHPGAPPVAPTRSELLIQAEAAGGQGVAVLLPLLADAQDGDAKAQVVSARTQQGLALRRLLRFDEAREVLTLADSAAMEILRRAERPDRDDLIRAAAAAMALGEVALLLDRPSEALVPLRRAAAHYEALNAPPRAFTPELFKTSVLLGDAASALGDARLAAASYAAALPLHEELLADPSSGPGFRDDAEVAALAARARAAAAGGK